MPKCDMCPKDDETVVCYEGYAVGIRLCPDCEEKIGYLDEMKKKNDVIKAAKATVKGELEAWKVEKLKDKVEAPVVEPEPEPEAEPKPNNVAPEDE